MADQRGQITSNELRPEATAAEPKASQMSKPSPHEVDRTRRTAERIAPLSAFRRFMDDMDRVFSGFGFGGPLLGGVSAADLIGGGWSPAIETLEEGNRLVFRADLPGLTKDDVNVEIVDDELVVSGERKQEHQETTKAGRFYSERRYGSFERRIVLPDNVDPESVEASFDNGVLSVSIAVPESVTARSRKVAIKSSAEAAKSPNESDKGIDSIH